MSTEADPLQAALHQTEPARGKCYLIFYNPNHELAMAELTPNQILPIITAWYLFPPLFIFLTIAFSTFSLF
jgi:UDPglucose--hexose-1-phosphate uridylyltransferase